VSHKVLSADAVGKLAAAASKKYGVPFRLLMEVCAYESGYQPDIVSVAGAVGLMQIIPMDGRPSEEELHDPAINMDEGALILASYAGFVQKVIGETFNWRLDTHLKALLCCYNAGPGYWAAHRDPASWPPGTRRYCDGITKAFLLN